MIVCNRVAGLPVAKKALKRLKRLFGWVPVLFVHFRQRVIAAKSDNAGEFPMLQLGLLSETPGVFYNSCYLHD